MHSYRKTLLAVGVAYILVLSGCAAEPAASSSGTQDAAPSTEQQTSQDHAADSQSSADSEAETSEVSIPAGAVAASAEFPFPIPEGWAILDPFVEEKLGKDLTIGGSVEYPGDAKDAANTYLGVLKAAGFDAYTYGPGELTNQASLAAEGTINGVPSIAILNFDVHADGYQRVSIIVSEKD